MWARVVEVMIGFWLLASPFIFAHPADEIGRWATDLGSAAVLITLAVLSYVPQTRHAHWFNILVGFWLCGYGYFAEPYPTPPALQNDLLVGLTVLMFAIIPNEASLPSQRWREVFQQQADT